MRSIRLVYPCILLPVLWLFSDFSQSNGAIPRPHTPMGDDLRCPDLIRLFRGMALLADWALYRAGLPANYRCGKADRDLSHTWAVSHLTSTSPCVGLVVFFCIRLHRLSHCSLIHHLHPPSSLRIIECAIRLHSICGEQLHCATATSAAGDNFMNMVQASVESSPAQRSSPISM
jgi:hypothetical protein